MKLVKIAITGPESSGKTTLCSQLAQHFSCLKLDEFAREYLEKTTQSYTLSDVEKIAELQWKIWQKAFNEKERGYIICDTEMSVPKIWVEDKFSSNSPTINKLWKKQSFDLIFLCYPDIPWESDPLREDPNRREELFVKYLNLFNREGRKIEILKGSNKLEQAIQKIGFFKLD